MALCEQSLFGVREASVRRVGPLDMWNVKAMRRLMRAITGQCGLQAHPNGS